MYVHDFFSNSHVLNGQYSHMRTMVLVYLHDWMIFWQMLLCIFQHHASLWDCYQSHAILGQAAHLLLMALLIPQGRKMTGVLVETRGTGDFCRVHYGKSLCLRGQSTISMALFNSKLLNCQRVIL